MPTRLGGEQDGAGTSHVECRPDICVPIMKITHGLV